MSIRAASIQPDDTYCKPKLMRNNSYGLNQVGVLRENQRHLVSFVPPVVQKVRRKVYV